ncbi:HAD family hydrolase [Kordiimonas marina]|uniref:sulfotransferase-like domain-containing protein n=1 Tax=Kordiimonas marina TaxID=2872312 RepID=UPI001FF1541A|nr:HAD family hydrolase [Kordiimonas marina]MCJ9428161.1 HAD family hydrolase [Kordiimonas marina]
MSAGADGVTRIAMWSGPRNISTAMMRSFENRPDTVVVDEPFYATFLKETGIDHPGRDAVLASQSTDWRTVADQLTGPVPAGKSVFYQKHMSHHMLPGMGRDWMAGLTHAFLIREPARMLASYVKTREEVTLEDLGLPQLSDLFGWVSDRLGSAPPVVDSRAVLEDPEGQLSALCAALGIPFDPAMLSWPAGKRDSDGVWAPWWYESVERSTGFMAPPEGPAPTLDARLQRIADAAQPYYDDLAQYRLG